MLVLIRKVSPIAVVVVEGLHTEGVVLQAKEVLRAAGGGQVGKVAGELRHLVYHRRQRLKKRGQKLEKERLTLMVHALVAMAVPTLLAPSWKSKVLQSSFNSTYTA